VIRLGIDYKTEKLERHLRHVSRVTAGHVRRRLKYWSDRIISTVRSNYTVFDNETGKLKQSLWTSPVRGVREPTQELGWAVPYGYVLEFGPVRKRTWVIKPKGFRSDIGTGRSGGGRSLRFLRFEAGGKIVYAREVRRVWNDSQKRPHFIPAFEKHERAYYKDLASIPIKVMSGELR
jgi:hypothetical protein